MIARIGMNLNLVLKIIRNADTTPVLEDFSDATDVSVTIQHDTSYIRYYKTILPSGYTTHNFKSYITGSGINQFEVLTSGVLLYDYYNNSGLITSYLTSPLEKASTYLLLINSGVLI